MEATAGVRPSFERNLDQLWYSGIVHPGQSYSPPYMRVLLRVTNVRAADIVSASDRQVLLRRHGAKRLREEKILYHSTNRPQNQQRSRE